VTVIGEIERKLDLIATIRKKGLWAMELSDCDLGVASEGFFGAHSSIFFKSADDEFLIFIDKKNNLEIIVGDWGKDVKNSLRGLKVKLNE
jgi:hypothetical protein